MAKFLSEDWFKDYAEEWNRNENLKSALKKFSAKIKYYIENSDQPPVFIEVKNGEVVDYGLADNSTKYDFEMWATPEDWKTLATGQMGPKAAMLTKRLKFKGSMIKAMKYMSPFEESLKMMGRVKTEWEG